MNNVLKKIITQKQKEVLELKSQSFVFDLHCSKIKSFKKNLLKPKSIIAEIKRASPANGFLASIDDSVLLAQAYEQAGASAVSVLTDEFFFNGSLNDLQDVSAALQHTSCAVLRKEFIIDSIQIDQAFHCGADAVLLIVAVLQDKTQTMLDYAYHLGLEVLLEVHTQTELTLALSTNATIIGINNRNLDTLTVDLQTSFELIQAIPDHIIAVSESGIHDANTAQRLFNAGFNALLVGEALVRSDNPADLIQAMRGETL